MKNQFAKVAWKLLPIEYKTMLIIGNIITFAFITLAIIHQYDFFAWASTPTLLASYYAFFRWIRLADKIKKGELLE